MLSFCKRCWIAELLLAVILIPFVGAGQSANPGGVWWEFGYPFSFAGADALDPEYAALSARIFALSREGSRGANTGIFLWENLDTLRFSGNLDHSAYLFSALLPWSDARLTVPFEPCACPLWATLTFDFACTLFLLVGLLFFARSPTVSRRPVLWMHLFGYTQLMILSYLTQAAVHYWEYSRAEFFNSPPHFNWLLPLLETLNFVAFGVILVSLFLSIFARDQGAKNEFVQ